MFGTTRFLTAALAVSVLTAGSAMAVDVATDDFESTAGAPIVEGRDMYPSAQDDGWLPWATQGSTFARLWNPSTADRYSNLTNEFYDTSWGGNDASGNADGSVIAIRTMSWDYRPSGPFTDPDGNRLWNPSDSGLSDGGIRYEWRFDQGGTPDHVRDSLPAPDPYTYVQEVDGGGAWQGTATRDFEAVSKNMDTFDSTAKYKLTVQVGRLATNGYNTGAVTMPGDDGLYGTADDVAGTSTRYVNDASSYWGGYMVDLIAGGDADTTGVSNGAFFYGQTTDSNADGYMGVLASDDDSTAVAVDSWGTSTIEYIPGVSGDFSALNGEGLYVRLAAKEIDGQHERTTSAAFDNVVLTKIMAGDANEDDTVNGTDLALLAVNFGGNTGMNWGTGDFSGDGIVNGTDLALLAGNFGFDASNPAAPVGISIDELATAVPEPTSIISISLIGAVALMRRRQL